MRWDKGRTKSRYVSSRTWSGHDDDTEQGGRMSYLAAHEAGWRYCQWNLSYEYNNERWRVLCARRNKPRSVVRCSQIGIYLRPDTKLLVISMNIYHWNVTFIAGHVQTPARPQLWSFTTTTTVAWRVKDPITSPPKSY